MKHSLNQLFLFDIYPDLFKQPSIDDSSIDDTLAIKFFDNNFQVGDYIINVDLNVLQILDLNFGEQSFLCRNVTNESLGKYVGFHFYQNKTSLNKFWASCLSDLNNCTYI